LKFQQILDLASKIEARASILNKEAKILATNLDDEQKNTVLESISRLLYLIELLFNLVGDKEHNG
jgi:hypothetical protein